MEFVPSSTIALEGLRRDGDLGLRDLQPHDDLAIERQDLTREQQKPTTTKELSAGARRSSKKISHTGQQIYICVRGEGRKEFVLPILCHRPPGCVGSERFKDEHGIMRTPSTREDPTPCDDDTLVYKKLNAACYKHYGAWKWWIPFYGVVNAQEVNFSFNGRAANYKKGWSGVRIYPIDFDEVRQHAEGIVNLRSKYNGEDEICEGDYHFKECRDYMDTPSNGPREPCYSAQASDAQKRIDKLDKLIDHVMRDCARNPSDANNHNTLDGMAQDSCIRDVNHRDFNPEEKMAGIEITLGWQTDRMLAMRPTAGVVVACAWIIAIVVGVSTRDWGTANGIGQFVVASITLLMAAVKIK